MAGHLLNAGYKLMVYNRTKEKSLELLNKGAIWANNVSDLAKNCNLIITIIGTPKDVEEVYLGKNGLIMNATQGSVLVDITTSSPKLAVKIYEAAKEENISVLDAPVTGGDIGAKEARLTIMVGGEKKTFDEVLPILNLMGKNVIYQGEAGFGQHTKLCNQISMAITLAGVCESLAYAKKSGVSPESVIKVLETGTAGSNILKAYGHRILASDFAAGFYVKHLIKDLKIALQESIEMGLDLEALKHTILLYEKLAAKGEEYSGVQALFKLYV
jgi:3-hydroxyisobutyrate dehydrogenase